jgi:bifunctional DNA-binding transcriptional regulator/antitoxin component of YhaV-PrlF toxin-antitoxin module
MVLLGRIVRLKTSRAVLLPKELAVSMGWNPGDRIACRMAGEKLILQRIALEELATIRTGEGEARP